MCNEPVEVGVGGTLNTEVVLAQIVDGLIIHEEGNIRVLQCCVGEQDRVVGLHYRCGDLAVRQSRWKQAGPTLPGGRGRWRMLGLASYDILLSVFLAGEIQTLSLSLPG